jgi:hypothetical protein
MAKTIRNFESLIPRSVTTETVNGTNHIPLEGWNGQQNTPERSGPYMEQRDERIPEKI